MKKIVIILFPMLILLLVVSDLHAQTIKFQLSDGTYKEYQLSDIDTMTFNNVNTFSVMNVFRKNNNITRLYTAYIYNLQIEKTNVNTYNLLITTFNSCGTGHPLINIPINDIDSISIIPNENTKFVYRSASISISDVDFVYEHKLKSSTYEQGLVIDTTYRDTTKGVSMDIDDNRCLDDNELFYLPCTSCVQNGINIDSNSMKICCDDRYYCASGIDYISSKCALSELVIKFNKNKDLIDTFVYDYNKATNDIYMSTLDQGFTNSSIILVDIPYIRFTDSLIAEVSMSTIENISHYSYSDSSGSSNSGYGDGSSITLVGYYPEFQQQPKIRIVLRK
jgi:hypothetical protein